MVIFQFLQLYYMSLIAGALFIVGWFSITRGSLEVMPDGSVKKHGKLFKGWYFFWFKIKEFERVYYKDEELEKFMVQVKQLLDCKATLNEAGASFNVGCAVDKEGEIEARFDVKLLVKPRGGATVSNDVFVYKSYPKYVYPDWVRDMLAGCVTCHSSWMGTLIYWAVIFFMREEVLGFFTSWTAYPILLAIVFNVVYCISLAWLVTALYSRTTK